LVAQGPDGGAGNPKAKENHAMTRINSYRSDATRQPPISLHHLDNLYEYEFDSGKVTDDSGVELRVWWVPQVPMEPFIYPVPTLEAARLVCYALSRYDLFQYTRYLTQDIGNAGGAFWRHPELTGGQWYDFDPRRDADYQEVQAAIAKATARPDGGRP
jgi:hypothetical protein